MAFIQNLFTSMLSINSPPIELFHQSHSADYDYGTGGKNARPCRACTDFKSWVNSNNANKSSKKSDSSSSQNQNSLKSSIEKIHPNDCPLDKDQLGSNSWSLLHTMAAYYPEQPSKSDETLMRNFIQGLARFYPCESCASDFRNDIVEDPPVTGSRTELSGWWCRMHNRVNRKLGKPQFDCSKVDERWLDGWKDGSCG